MQADNLDLKCAKAANQVVTLGSKDDQLEKLCNDCSSVLAAHGPYALYLYLWSREKKNDAALILIRATFDLLLECFPSMGPKFGIDRRTSLDQIGKLSENLDDLLLARRLLSRTLSYVRYHAKANSAVTT